MFGKLSIVNENGAVRADGDIKSASLLSLRQAKADLARYARGIADKFQASAGGELSDAARCQLRVVSGLAADVNVELTQREADNEAERQDAARHAGLGADAEASSLARVRAGLAADPAGTHSRPTGPRFAEMFPQAGASLDGWESRQEFCHVVGHGLHDRRLKAASQTGNIGSAGGYSVPPGVLGPWLDLALESEIVRSRATVWPITVGRERNVPAWDLTDRSNGIAGLTIEWETEAPTTDANVQVAKMRMLQLRARRGAIFAEVSNELEADGLDFSAQMDRVMSGAIGYGLDQNFLLTGTGANNPQSIYNSGALISVARQVTNQIVYDDLTAMFARMSPASIPRSVWVAHSSTIPMLSTLSVAVGTGGSHVPVMTQSNGKFYILTREVIFSEKVRPLGQLSDIGLFDFSQYVIGMRADASLDKSIHVGFKRNMTTYRLQLRIDGMPNISAPYQPPNSAPTQSPFVALAA
jgi:HK97 family phage major capsid protein